MDPTRILVVESEGVIAADLERRLKEMGHTVTATAAGGQQALEAAERTPPDLVIRGDSRLTIRDLFDRALTPGFSIGMNEKVLLQPRTGTELPIDDSIAPIRDKAKQVTGVVVVFRDGAIIERLGGRLHAEGQIDRGATFHFFVPKTREASAGSIPN